MSNLALNLDPLVIKTFDYPLAVDVANRTFDCYITKSVLDRDKEYIEPAAFLDNIDAYKASPVLLIGHNHKTSRETLPVGKALKLEFLDDGIKARYYVTKNPIGDEILTLLSESILRGISAGFIPIDFITNPSDSQLPYHIRGKGCRKYYKKVELVEVSILSIPSNRDALILQAEKGNKFAGLVLKGMDDSTDITPVLKEWIEKENAEPKSLWLGFSLDEPSKDALDALDVSGKKEPKDNLHTTVRYFGKVSDENEVDKVKRLLARLQLHLKPQYDLEPVDYALFDDNHCLVGRYRNGAVTQLHEATNNLLKSENLDYPETFPFLDSHVTLSTDDMFMDEDLPQAKPFPVQTDMLQLRWGDEVIAEYKPYQYTLKALLAWNEQDHPRDDSGMFTAKPGSGLEPLNIPSPHLFFHADELHEQTQKKLQQIVNEEREIHRNVKEMNDRDSWKKWATKWLVRIGTVAGLYYGLKTIAKHPETRQKIADWLTKGTKGAKEGDVVDQLLSFMDTTKVMLDKGKELGLENTSDYQKLQKFYDKMMAAIAKNVGTCTNISTKEMSKEEFKEEEHPRAKDGKFTDKNGTSTGEKVVTAVAGAGAAVALVAGGIKVAKTAAVVNRFNNRAAVKNAVEDIVSACSKPHPNKKALENIVNISVMDKMDNKVILNKRERAFVDYVANTDQLQKDLAATFGHLEGGGTKTIVMHSGWINALEALKGMNPHSLETFRKAQMVYMRDTGNIHMNVSVFDYVMKQQKDFSGPKQLIMHEYAHSIAADNPNILLKHYKDYEQRLRSLIGQEINVTETDAFGNKGETIKGIVRDFRIVKTNVGEAARQQGARFDSATTRRLNGINEYAGVLKVQTGNKRFKEIEMSKMPMAQLHAQLSGRAFQLDHIKTPRELYALQNLDEYFAVLAESGGKL